MIHTVHDTAVGANSPKAAKSRYIVARFVSVQFRRRENRTALERYLTGLLTDHPHKNCDTLATVVPDASEQQLQGLLTTMQWDADALNRVRVEQMLELPTEGDAVLIFLVLLL